MPQRRDDDGQIHEALGGQSPGRRRRPAIGEVLWQRDGPEWTALANVHTASRGIAICAFKQDREPLASERVEGMRDQERSQLRAVR